MYMKLFAFKYNIFVLFTGLLLLNGCEKEIDINIPEKDKKIVLNGLINTDSLFSVNVSKSLNILDVEDVKYLDNATVSIYENGNFIEELNYISGGNYKSSFFVSSEGKTYKVKVDVPEMQSASAETFIPEASISDLTIDTITTIYEEEFYSYKGLKCNIGFNDLSNEENYYWFCITGKRAHYEWDSVNHEEIITYEQGNIYFNSNDPVIESWVSGGYGFIFSDKLFNGSNIDFNIYLEKYMLYDLDTNVLHFNVNSISEDFYLYAATYNSHMEAQNDPFTEPVQVYSNIENGYGIFAGYSTVSDSITVCYEWDEDFKKKLGIKN